MSRPSRVSVRDIVSRRMRLVLEPAGEHYKTLRRYITNTSILHEVPLNSPSFFRAVRVPLSPKATGTYAPMQIMAAQQFILNILEKRKIRADLVRSSGHQAHPSRHCQLCRRASPGRMDR